jgi:hypothetical protein
MAKAKKSSSKSSSKGSEHGKGSKLPSSGIGKSLKNLYGTKDLFKH